MRIDLIFMVLFFMGLGVLYVRLVDLLGQLIWP